MEGTMSSRLARIFSYLLIAPAALPLVYVSGLVYPYVAPKTFLLQGTGIIALAVFVHLALSGRPFFYGRLRNRLTWIPVALLAVAYITSIFGIDFYRSFWGLFDRGDGLLTSTIITVFFYLILISADRKLLGRLVKAVAVVAGLVAAIAVLQWSTTISGAEAAFLPPVTGRIGSTLGNAAFLAGYLGMALFVILAALRDSIGFWRVVYKTSAVLSVLAILFAATRGTILALVVAGVAWLAYIALKMPSPAQEKKGSGFSLARVTLIAIVIFGGLFVAFRGELAKIPFEPVARIASISLSDETVASRLFVWQNIGAEALRRPFLGYGAEHIDQVFDKVYDPTQIVEQWFDRSHNSFLDYFVQYGVFGLALYIALIGAFVAYAVKLRQPLFLLLIFTYVAQNFFVFDTPVSLWLLYALLACLVVLSDDSSAVPFSPMRLPSFVPSLVSIAMFLLIIPVVVLPLYANVMLTQGYLFHLVDVNRANAYFKRGLALGTHADLEYGYQAYSMYTDHQAVKLSGRNRVAAYDYALSVLTANFKKYPYDARTATYLGHVIDTAPPEVAVDDAFDTEVLARAIELSPLRAQAWYMTVNISLRKANALPEGSQAQAAYYREAIGVLEGYAGKEKSLPVSRYILATIYYKLDERDVAKKWADEALPLYTTPDTATARPAVKYYLATHDWRNAVRFLADIVEADPLNSDALYDLAKVTYLAGDPAAAERIVEKIRATNPDILKTDQNFLNAITAYEQSKK
jgi:O-antigen ligase